MIRKLFKFLAVLLIILATAFCVLLIFSTVTDFHPEPGSELEVEAEGNAINSPIPDTLSILIWNIGYAGLGAEMDFFNDGGKGTRPSSALNSQYLNGIGNFIASIKDSTDFIMIQEIDRDSKRSYETDQVNFLLEKLPGFEGHFAVNYDVKFVPVPFAIPYKPYGKTFGGLGTFSPHKALDATRIQYPGGFSWPTKLYMLDRCALEQRYPFIQGKELVVVNTHNTAYDATGEIKKIEMAFMKMRYEEESRKGNFVIVGGDWNQVPPGITSDYFSKNISEGYTPHPLTMDAFPSKFTLSVDSSMATNRSNETPYLKGKTYVTLIDYFITSPNLEVISVKAIDLGFKYSDHQPVMLKVCVKNY